MARAGKAHEIRSVKNGVAAGVLPGLFVLVLLVCCHVVVAGPEGHMKPQGSEGSVRCVGGGSDKDAIKALVTLYRLATREQFLGDPRSQSTTERTHHLEEAGDIYDGMLEICAFLPLAAHGGGASPVVSRVYSAVAAFASRTGYDRFVSTQPKQLIERALALDPGNAVAWYELARVAREDPAGPEREARIVAACSKALAIDPKFPEAWLELGLSFLRTGRTAEADATRTRFLATLVDFKPELHLFDSGYPEVFEQIGLPGHVILKQQEFRPDEARFELGLKP
jgi:hypothetical protein